MKQQYYEANRKKRNNPANTTPQEKVVEKYLKSKKIAYIKEYERMCGSKQYFIDFYLPKKNLGVEVDGNQHYSLKGIKKDRRKATMIMKYHGIAIIHIKNSEVDKNDFYKIDEYKIKLIKDSYKIKPKKSKKKINWKEQYAKCKEWKLEKKIELNN